VHFVFGYLIIMVLSCQNTSSEVCAEFKTSN